MTRQITLALVVFFAIVYLMALSWAYGDDKQMCQAYGYTSNTISPTLEGMCIKEVDKNVTQSVNVEDLMIQHKRKELYRQSSICSFDGYHNYSCQHLSQKDVDS